MDSVRVSPIKFKGIYKIKGHSDILDEISWFMRRQSRRKEQLAMDFVNIRLKREAPSVTDVVLRRTSNPEIDQNERLATITDHILDLISIRNKTMKPFMPTEKDNIDLFATGVDIPTIERKITGMVEDSLQLNQRNIPIREKVRLLVDNLTQAMDNLHQGKPIVNISSVAVRNRLHPLDLNAIPILPAERVFEGIQKGKFDTLSGTLAIA